MPQRLSLGDCCETLDEARGVITRQERLIDDLRDDMRLLAIGDMRRTGQAAAPLSCPDKEGWWYRVDSEGSEPTAEPGPLPVWDEPTRRGWWWRFP